MWDSTVDPGQRHELSLPLISRLFILALGLGFVRVLRSLPVEQCLIGIATWFLFAWKRLK